MGSGTNLGQCFSFPHWQVSSFSWDDFIPPYHKAGFKIQELAKFCCIPVELFWDCKASVLWSRKMWSPMSLLIPGKPYSKKCPWNWLLPPFGHFRLHIVTDLWEWVGYKRQVLYKFMALMGRILPGHLAWQWFYSRILSKLFYLLFPLQNCSSMCCLYLTRT